MINLTLSKSGLWDGSHNVSKYFREEDSDDWGHFKPLLNIELIESGNISLKYILRGVKCLDCSKPYTFLYFTKHKGGY